MKEGEDGEEDDGEDAMLMGSETLRISPEREANTRRGGYHTGKKMAVRRIC